MTFQSILYKNTEDKPKEDILETPAFFEDLFLDQIIDRVTAGKQEYNLKPFFYTPLKDLDLIAYRQEVMRDLENKTLFESFGSFAFKMGVTRRYLAMVEKLDYKYHIEGWFLESVIIYCDAITSLANDLDSADLNSCGLLAFREYLMAYARSDQFTSLIAESKKNKEDLSTVKYSVIIKNLTVKVRKYESEVDYSEDVVETFEKFRQGAVKDYKVKLSRGSGMNHVEARILDLIARLYPEIFQNLINFFNQYANYIDEIIRVFDREIQFYIAYLDYAARFRQAGLNFCYPVISSQVKEVFDYEGFDLALAHKCISGNSPIVCNDFYLKDKERIIIVSGPNQGGKTTFARTFGQLHYLASLGCLIPGREAQLFLFDRLFTHFEKEEDIRTLRGKLQDDLVRIHAILDQATPNSIILINEIFTSTTLEDAVFLSRKIIDRIMELDLLCVCVTFIDELASLSEKTVSMVSTVVPENPTLRTYKVIRKPADGLAYAISIAEKYRLTYDSLKERIRA